MTSATFTFADLNASDAAQRLHIDGKPVKLAVVGHPVEHSLSPAMHQPAIDALGLDYAYARVDLAPDDFAAGIQRMATLGMLGCNVTIPHKQAAFKVANEHDPISSELQVANTLVFDNGEILAYSTDGPGFVNAITEQFSIPLASMKVLILGAGGGAGTCIARQCAHEGVEQLILANRTIEKLDPLYQLLAPHLDSEHHLSGPGDRLLTCPMDSPELIELANQADLIVNATAIGLKRTDPSPLPHQALSPHHLVYDAIYRDTRLLKDARSHGASARDGRSMLLHQGALAFDIWLDQAPDIELMRDALNAAING